MFYTALVWGYLGAANAGVSADEARKLGAELTPAGAEKAGNKDGSIPAYTGGLTSAPAGYDKATNVRPDPFAAEKPLYSVDAKSMDKYADKLTEGTKAVMKGNPEYRVDVYPTHRTAAYPKFVLDNTLKNATSASVDSKGDIQGARAGIPYPIPKTGVEAMWNFVARFYGMSMQLPRFSAYNVDSAGKLVLSNQGSYMTEGVYYDENKPDAGVLNRVRTEYTGPARRAGESAMVIDAMDGEKGRRAWQYLPGQRRVRLAPDLSYDTPNPGTNGMSTYDDVNLFNGRMDRFDFKLVGKKEIIVPYNTYRFSYADKPEQVFLAKSINPDVLRWELHRVWVVEATLKEGARHVYARRTFYLDEDSWAAVATDAYDGRGQLWRAGFAYLTQSYDVPVPTTTTAGHYDVIAGTYYVNLWPGAGGVKVSEKPTADATWSGDAMAAKGVR